MHTILITTSSFGNNAPHLFKTLRENGFKVVVNPFGRKLKKEELKELLNQHRPVGLLAGTEPITQSILKFAKEYLKVISRVGVGWDNVDRDAAQKLDIQVYRTEGVLNKAVAELTLGMILSALRAILLQDRKIRDGKWEKGMGSLLQGKVVGVIGFGSIGQCVGKLISAFDATVLYCDPVSTNVSWAKPVSMHDLLAQSDIVTIHADAQHQILGEEELNYLCKPGVIIVNTSRGGLVNEKTLYEALISGHVSFACLDVFDQEPYSGPLTQLENVILTPHIGSYAKEARIRMEEMAVENLLHGLAELVKR
ncbi:MAG: phosphoglycerate dehydrogenase [Deltaproteobacteria bacterium]|nr:phosphoglycerate dehydrogenase [Deltaproteobacteria bacterium]